MSKQNVEIVRRGFDAFNRGDMEAWLDDMDPAVEYCPTKDFPEAGPFKGHDDVRRLVEQMLDAFESFALQPQELIDAGDKVVASVLQTGRGKGSGLFTENRFVYVITLRDGKAVRFDTYYDRRQAFEAAGLEQQTPS
jgi:uncharacterized protein